MTEVGGGGGGGAEHLLRGNHPCKQVQYTDTLSPLDWTPTVHASVPPSDGPTFKGVHQKETCTF